MLWTITVILVLLWFTGLVGGTALPVGKGDR